MSTLLSKVSIVIPIYNSSSFLKKCLDSIVNQTYNNIEVILVNDGSTDESLDICKLYRNKDQRIKIINQKNMGLSSARNVGIEQSTGEYIVFVDSDDFIDCKMIEILYKKMVKNKVSIAICDLEKFKSEEEISFLEKSLEIEQKTYNLYEYFNEILNMRKSTYVCGAMYEKKLFNNVKFPVGTYFEDLAIFYKIIRKCKKIIYCPIKLYKYRQNNNSIVHTLNNKKIFDYSYNARKMCDYIFNLYPDLNLKINAYMSNVYITCYYILLRKDDKSKDKYLLLFNECSRKMSIKNLPFSVSIKLLAFKVNNKLGSFLMNQKQKRM